MTKLERAQRVYNVLLREYPDARCSLVNIDPVQFLFANILSPQTTDLTVNKVSQELYSKFGSAQKIAAANVRDIRKLIRPAGLSNIKAKRIKDAAQRLVSKFNGNVPGNLADLRSFPGIGRKTALVILSESFNKVEGIIVDTHNIRIARRLGLTSKNSADAIEKDLMKILPQNKWRMWSHIMVFHGRAVCTARKPGCQGCPVRSLCLYGSKCLNN